MRVCTHRGGRWQRTPQGSQRVDAAHLLGTLRGATPADGSPGVTTRAVLSELCDDGYVYRFRHDDRPRHEVEGAFLLCGFHLATVLGLQGDAVNAAGWFERTRAAQGTPGIFTEEYDVWQRQLRGNLPQAFVHAALIEGAALLADVLPGDQLSR